jgi:hypothetical protein
MSSLRRVFLWVGYYALCLSFLWSVETFSKARAVGSGVFVCFFYSTESCERMISTTTSPYVVFSPILTWIALLGFIGLFLTLPFRGERAA